MGAKDFRELRVYQSAFELAVEIYTLSKGFPVEERYSLTDQIRRSSRSVAANIAEAWRKRRYSNSFVSKLSDADAEAAETSVWLDFAREFGLLTEEQFARLFDRYDHVCSQLAIMMASPEKWRPQPKSHDN
jgi:four helix bundle protein